MNSDVRAMLTYEANKKSTGVAYLLWFFLGGLGVHRFYLGRTGSGAAILILTLLSLLLSFVGIGFITIWIPVIWVLIDVFLIPGMTRDYNMRLVQMMN